MKKSTVTLIVAAVIVLLLIFWGVGQYNSLVTTNENIDSKWSQVENNLQRRADLIPNLVETVKGYAAHEEGIFTEIADARSRLLGAGNVTDAAEANSELSSALGRLLAIGEAYPQLKANENFIALQDQLEGTENRIAAARKDYNDAVQSFNTRVKRFPTNIFAGMFGYESRAYFEADEAAKEVPNVSF